MSLFGRGATPELSRSEDRLSLLGAVVAGTLSAGLSFAEPGWGAVPVGIAAPVLVGLAFPHARTWQLVAGLVLGPLVVAVIRAELLWLALLTLPQHGGPPIRGAQISPRHVRVAAEVSAGWQRRCVRGVREQGSFATVEILLEGC
ncbi:MAG TPA: hypothetical protein VGR26_07475 [Acidimicrobiales bacterium]|nr:hypothetical protein [Acidimicrobiales bacterium]